MHKRDPILDPLFWGTPVRFCESFAPLGSILQVESNHELVIEAARKSFGRYPPPSLTRQPDYHIRLHIDPVYHQSKPWPKPSFRALWSLFHVACGEASFAIADLKSRRAGGFVSAEIAEDSSFFRNVFLECLFYVLATHHAYTPVHCASVALKGRGVFICGPSGAGKTSLVYACACDGMQILSDDVVHVRANPGSDSLTVWGNPFHLRLLPTAVGLFPELEGRPAHLRSDYEPYLEIDMAEEFSRQIITSCLPAALVFLERNQQSDTRLESISARAAYDRLKLDIFLTEQSACRRHYRVLRKLVQTPAYLLSYDAHPSQVVETIKRLCS
jgi:hypothetical protein